MSERIILHLDMNAFFASVEQLSNPHLRERPVLVCGNRNSRSVVASASYEARSFGVRNGMPIQEAVALCPGAELLEGNIAKYADIFSRVVRMMERYSPDIEVFSIDEAFMDLTKTADRFGGALKVACALQDDVRMQLGLPCSIGIGPNKLIAKLASSRKKPNGIVQIKANEVRLALRDLPVEELCGIGPAFKEALNEDGITTCSELSRAPIEYLTKRFGLCAAMHLARLSRGIDESPLEASPEAASAKSMGHMQTLSHDTLDRKLIDAVLLGLAEKIGRRLRAENAAARRISLSVRYRDFTTFSRSRTFDEFFDDGREIYRASSDMLSKIVIAQPLRMLGICASSLSYGPHQSWWLPEVNRRRRLLAACDWINDRFGQTTLFPAALMASEAKHHYQIQF